MGSKSWQQVWYDHRGNPTHPRAPHRDAGDVPFTDPSPVAIADVLGDQRNAMDNFHPSTSDSPKSQESSDHSVGRRFILRPSQPPKRVVLTPGPRATAAAVPAFSLHDDPDSGGASGSGLQRAEPYLPDPTPANDHAVAYVPRSPQQEPQAAEEPGSSVMSYDPATDDPYLSQDIAPTDGFLQAYPDSAPFYARSGVAFRIGLNEDEAPDWRGNGAESDSTSNWD